MALCKFFVLSVFLRAYKKTRHPEGCLISKIT